LRMVRVHRAGLAGGEIAVLVLPCHLDDAPLDVHIDAVACWSELHAELGTLHPDRDARGRDGEATAGSRRNVAVDATVVEIERHRLRIVARDPYLGVRRDLEA